MDDTGADAPDDVVTPDCNPGNATELRKRLVENQYPAAPELRFVSGSKKYSAFDTQDFVYDSNAGKGITVYVIDSGMNSDNVEISNSATRSRQPSNKYRWLFPNTPFWKKRPAWQTEDDPVAHRGHGTCVISKVIGERFGVAKLANLVVLKHRFNSRGGPMSSSILENLALVLADVKANKLQGKAVLNLSFGGSGTSPAFVEYVQALDKVMGNLIANDVVVVVASGNDVSVLSLSLSP